MISCKVSTFSFATSPRERPTKAPTTASNLKPTKSESFRFCTCSSSSSSSSAGLVSAGEGVNDDDPTRKILVDEEEEEEEEEGRNVECEVEVISWRERRIKGQVTVRADVLSVWNVITDYERLADFIPNLVSSGRIPCPHPGRIWLEQRGVQRSMYWHIEARVVLDLQEFISSADNRELQFCMVDGDFKKFDGKWTVKSSTSRGTTILWYEVNVVPRFNFPAIFLERIITSDLPVNLRALACQAEKDFADNGKTGCGENEQSINVLSSLGINSFLNQKDKISADDSKQTGPGSSFGHGPSSTKELNGNWGVFGQICKLKRPAMVDEVHLRRFDGLLENGGVHRCVIASITVKASVREVWNVLTAYESLPEIVPNLAISKILTRENNKVRILQEGCKGLLYMVLHARVVLDLCERHQQEISFQQVKGDFDSFQGKWSLEQLGSHHTLLKYSVESKMHKNSLLSEAIMEEVVYEDLPSNLCAIRDYIERRESARSSEANSHVFRASVDSRIDDNDSNNKAKTDQVDGFSKLKPCIRKPKVPGLQKDYEVLKSELQKFISEHGQEGFMPMRKQLRLHGRVDIEKAINHKGGFRRIATLMNLSLAYKHRKPKGYWDKLENLQEEINRFQRIWGMDPSFMPSRKAFERAGRYDIARALEKWGGLHEVSRLLSFKVRHPNRQQANLPKDKKTDHHVVTSNSTIHEGDKMVEAEDFVQQDPEKWVLKLKDLGINWLEY